IRFGTYGRLGTLNAGRGMMSAGWPANRTSICPSDGRDIGTMTFLIRGANMKLSRTVSYAVKAMVALAAAPRESPVCCKNLAESGEMPERFLLQILRTLVT